MKILALSLALILAGCASAPRQSWGGETWGKPAGPPHPEKCTPLGHDLYDCPAEWGFYQTSYIDLVIGDERVA